jgi:septum formation protein
MSFKVRELLSDKRVVLASASPRRKELLRLLTENFEIIPSQCGEDVDGVSDVYEIPKILAERKCREVANRCNPDGKTVVIGCDTLVIDPDGNPLGKPADEADALRMLKLLQGAQSSVISGVCVYYGGEYRSFSENTEVLFRPADDGELLAYIATGEPLDKAGAYAIQGLGGILIESIEGDYNNVVGLPVSELARLLAQILGAEK